MIPKVQCCIDAIHRGVERVFILMAAFPLGVVEILTDEGVGTMFLKEKRTNECNGEGSSIANTYARFPLVLTEGRASG